jgi:hypothetical protein
VVAGAGAAVLHEVARRLDRSCRNFEDLIVVAPGLETAAAISAPAAAVALLASRQPPAATA